MTPNRSKSGVSTRGIASVTDRNVTGSEIDQSVRLSTSVSTVTTRCRSLIVLRRRVKEGSAAVAEQQARGSDPRDPYCGAPQQLLADRPRRPMFAAGYVVGPTGLVDLVGTDPEARPSAELKLRAPVEPHQHRG